jgi:leader peptidase (prepilin peptidase)/N-methyltransferase
MVLEHTWLAYLGFLISGLISGGITGKILNNYLCRDEESFSFHLAGGIKELNLIAAILVFNAALYILIFQLYGFSWEAIAYCYLVSLLLLIASIDLKTMLIPNWSILALLPAGLLLAFVIEDVSWQARLIGLVTAGMLLLVIAIVSRGGLGIGDVKLMAAAGFCLGWKATFLALFLAAVLGGTTGLAILAAGKGNLKTEIPFGPFLVIGIITTFLCGKDLILWYLNLF